MATWLAFSAFFSSSSNDRISRRTRWILRLRLRANLALCSKSLVLATSSQYRWQVSQLMAGDVTPSPESRQCERPKQDCEREGLSISTVGANCYRQMNRQ